MSASPQAKRLRLILEPRDINWVRWELLLLEKTERKEAEEAKLLAPSADEDEDDPDAPDPDALAAAATRALDRAYFQAYEDPAAHQAELQDAPLQDAWRQAIQLLGPSHIRGKVVLVLGCGPGHLAVLCAKAGAKQVIAVDGAPAMVQLCSQVAQAEGVGAFVTAVDGPVESLLLSNKADVLIANWAGPGLLAGGMLRSLVNARIRLLKPGGLILPSRAEIFVGGIEDRDALAASKRQWERGFATRLDLSAAMAGIVGRPRCGVLTRASQLCTDTPSILRFNPADVKMSQARRGWQNLPFQLRASREERLWGLVLFFDLGFGAAQVPTQLVAGDATAAEAASSTHSASTSPEAPPEVAVFTTHPGAADTHYNQLILNFPRAVKVRQGEVLQGTLTLTPAGDSGRDLEVMLQVCVGEATASAAFDITEARPALAAATQAQGAGLLGSNLLPHPNLPSRILARRQVQIQRCQTHNSSLEACGKAVSSTEHMQQLGWPSWLQGGARSCVGATAALLLSLAPLPSMAASDLLPDAPGSQQAEAGQLAAWSGASAAAPLPPLRWIPVGHGLQGPVKAAATTHTASSSTSNSLALLASDAGVSVSTGSVGEGSSGGTASAPAAAACPQVAPDLVVGWGEGEEAGSTAACKLLERLLTPDTLRSPGSALFARAGTTYFPRWMFGEWRVSSSVRDTRLPLGPQFVDAALQAGDLRGGPALQYTARWFSTLPDTWDNTVRVQLGLLPTDAIVPDRAYNTRELSNATLGWEAVASVAYDPREEPDRATVEFSRQGPDGRTIPPRRIELFINRSSSEALGSATFLTDELCRQVDLGVRAVDVVDYETMTGYRLLAPGKVAARQRTAVYLDPRHPLFFKPLSSGWGAMRSELARVDECDECEEDDLLPTTHHDSSKEEACPVPPNERHKRHKGRALNAARASNVWLRVDNLGNASLVTSDKWSLAMKLGVQPRDLRLLDPQMASVSPPAILDRERCIVVNLGSIKWSVPALHRQISLNVAQDPAPWPSTLSLRCSRTH
ncbi:hypothetical protein QJQ45_010830 [Haematococcus lacustris]|nr:hypothetical protein QJQ45_010830 [Haematococcus lacustris]